MTPLTWQNDPFLLDPEPAAMSEWATANKIIATGKQAITSIINDQTLKMNLLPILVRRIDFVREKESDRILSRFPYLVLTDEEKQLINTKILLIAEFARDYFYQSITSGIMAWKKRLNTYLERGAMPYPLYRCACEVLNWVIQKQDTEALPFESARGKRYVIPTKLSPTLVYLCGVVNGDGHLYRHWLRVVDETKEHIKLLSKLFSRLFSDPGEIFQTGNAWNVELRSSSAVRLFNFLTDQTIQGAKYNSLQEPFLVKQLGEPFRQLYWRGAMDADGSYKHHISFGSASETYVNDFNTYLHSVGIKSKTGRIGDYAFSLTIPAFYRLKFFNHIGVDNPKKKKDMLQLFKLVRRQFKGLNNETLIEGIYFNLLKLSSLSIHGIGQYLIQIRGKKSVKDRSKELGIAFNLYSDYESEIRTLTLKTLQKIMQIGDKTLMELLLKQPNLLYQSSTSKRVKLPIVITSRIIEIMSLLEPTKTYVKLLHNDKEIASEIEQLFGITLEHGRINNRIVLNFCKEFGDYPKPTINELKLNSILDF